MAETSFPFLAIARKHGVDYGAIVRLASWMDTNDDSLPPSAKAVPDDALRDILIANSQERQRRAMITGRSEATP